VWLVLKRDVNLVLNLLWLVVNISSHLNKLIPFLRDVPEITTYLVG
jgi:hypothetical protein